MSRCLIKVLVCLVLGGVTTVAVAWGCAMWSPTTREARVADLPYRDLVGFGYTLRRAMVQRQYREIAGFDYSNPALPLSFWKRQKMAWRRVPIGTLPVSLRWRRIVFGLGTALPSVVALPLAVLVIVSIEVRIGRVGSFVPLLLLLAVPMFWIWACVLYGFFMRTDHYHRIRLEGFEICLKCGYWLLTLGPFTARRFIHRMRGHCINCGYDLRGAEHEVCPECGAGCDGV